jgi:hypothetical protein
MEKKAKIWVTKYALTKGILEIEEAILDESNPRVAKYTDARGYLIFYYGDDWHLSLEAAICHARAMLEKSIANLKRRVLRLSKLSQLSEGQFKVMKHP